MKKGYIKAYSRKNCQDCLFYSTNSGRKPICEKDNSNVGPKDICDEHEEFTYS